MLVTMIERDNYLGRIATGRVVSGAVRDGDAIKSIPYADKPPEAGKVCSVQACIIARLWMLATSVSANCACLLFCTATQRSGFYCVFLVPIVRVWCVRKRRRAFESPRPHKDARSQVQTTTCLQVTRIMKRAGASGSQARPAANAGDIISLAGIASAAIGDTICAPAVTAALQPGQIDPPTLSMVFAPNSSPIGRVAGNVVTAQKILERLQHEAAQSVSLQVLRLPRGALGRRKQSLPPFSATHVCMRRPLRCILTAHDRTFVPARAALAPLGPLKGTGGPNKRQLVGKLIAKSAPAGRVRRS